VAVQCLPPQHCTGNETCSTMFSAGRLSLHALYFVSRPAALLLTPFLECEVHWCARHPPSAQPRPVCLCFFDPPQTHPPHTHPPHRPTMIMPRRATAAQVLAAVLLALLLVQGAQAQFSCDSPGTSITSASCPAGFISCSAGTGTPCTINGETYHINYGSQVITNLQYTVSLTNGGPAVTLPNSTWVQQVRVMSGSNGCSYSTAFQVGGGTTALYPSPPAFFKTVKRTTGINTNFQTLDTFTVCMPATGNLPQPACSVAMAGVGQYTRSWQW